MTDRKNLVDSFIHAGGSVCPYARSSERVYVSVGRLPAPQRREILRALRPFAQSQGRTPNQALLVLGPEGLAEFEQTKAWAREVFLELMICSALVEGVPEAEAVKYVKTEVRPILLDDADPRRPVIGCSSQPTYAICMAPVYPKTHPRYAPRPMVVVTWVADVELVRGREPAASRIREAMRREHGFVYDADDLMLPLPDLIAAGAGVRTDNGT